MGCVRRMADSLCHTCNEFSASALTSGVIAFQRLTSRCLLFRVASSSLAREHIGHDVVAERRILTFWIQIDPSSRQRDRFVEVLSAIKVGLGQKKMALGKAGIHFDCALELGDLTLSIPGAFVQTSQIER